MLRTLGFGTVAAALLTIVSLQFVPQAAAVTAGGPSADLADALARNGLVLETPAAGQAISTAGFVTPDEAVASYRAVFGSEGETTVFFGQLTDSDWHVGDESTALVIVNRPVYVVRTTGLDLKPTGGGRGDNPPPASADHHELIAFVDARTGESLLATTVR
jgi:hypothetical protein